MAATVTQVRLLGPDMRCYDVDLELGDTTTGAQNHGLPFTPTFSAFIITNDPGHFGAFALAVSATTWTLTCEALQGAASIRVFVGRMTNPQNHR